MIRIKRAYASPGKEDGYRVLVDRLWPRGLAKATARIDVWLKGVAPSTALRKWFDHDPKKWITFQRKYTDELKSNEEELNQLRDIMKAHRTVTLVYGAKDESHNQAIVLRDFLLNQQ